MQQEQKRACSSGTSRGGGRGINTLNQQIMARCLRARWFANEAFIETSGGKTTEFVEIPDDDSSFETPPTESSEDIELESESEESDSESGDLELSDDEEIEPRDEYGDDDEDSESH